MFKNRNLNPKELKFVTKQITNTKKVLIWLLITVVIIVAFLALAVYSTFDDYNVVINVLFGVLIMCIYAIYSYFKGFEKHKINPEVHQSNGFYERVVIHSGKSTRRFDTLNGINVKIPWHWRSYLKSQKESVDYEYILRDGAVAANDSASQYVVSLNDTLSLDYELNHGLEKAKPLNFFNFLSFFLFPFIVMFSFMNNDLDKGLNITQIFQNENDAITVNSAEELNTISQPSYITIKNAWVHRFKTMSDYRGKVSLISKAERDRIYNNPSSNFNHKFFVPARAITKPDKETYIKNIKSNPLYEKFNNKITSDSILNKYLESGFNERIKIYNEQIKRAERAEKIVENLQPKTIILKLNSEAFHAKDISYNSVKESLENHTVLNGFYSPKANTFVSIDDQRTEKKRILNAFVSLCALVFSSIFTLFSIGKVIYNYRLKKQLVKDQIQFIHGSKRINQ